MKSKLILNGARAFSGKVLEKDKVLGTIECIDGVTPEELAIAIQIGRVDLEVAKPKEEAEKPKAGGKKDSGAN